MIRVESKCDSTCYVGQQESALCPIDRFVDQAPCWCRISIVEPVESHTKLSVNQEGLAVLRSIPGPVIPVVVIGPYRSGKSFLLNQLLGVGCSKLHVSCIFVDTDIIGTKRHTHVMPC